MIFSQERFLRAALLTFLGLMAVAQPADGAKLTDFYITNTRSDLLLYLKVDGAFTAPIEKAIYSGVPTTFSFYVKLDQRRSVWLDRTVADITLTHTVKYNNLKREFHIRRSWAGEEEIVTHSLAEAKRAMTEIDGFSVIRLDGLEKGETYRIQVKAKLSKMTLPLYLHYLLMMASMWEFETDWYVVDFDY